MSGFSGDEFYPSDESLVSSAAGANTVASLQAGHPFSLLLAEDDALRESMLDSTLDAVADAATRFVRATNPLRARLTLERLLLQVIQGGADPEQEDPSVIIRRIAARLGDERRVILVIERSETLHPEVLRFFGGTAAMFPDGIPQLQILFVGRPEFQRMLEDPDAGFDEQTQQLEAYRPTAPEPLFAAVPEQEETEVVRPYIAPQPGLIDQLRSIWNQGFTTRLGIVGGTLTGIAAVAFAVFIAVTGEEPPVVVDSNSALMEMPEPLENDPDPPVLQAGPAPDQATAELRAEFESYLIASGRDVQNATQGQKRAIYQEFLVWRARTAPPK